MALWRSIGTRKDATRGTVPIETRKGTSAYWATTGVVAGGPTVLGSGTAGFAYSVAGPVQFVTSRGASDGHHVYGNDGATTVPITNAAGVNTPGAPGSGLQRIDICWTRHQTAGENGDPAATVANASAPLFGVESGTAASANPQAPSLPAGAIELFRNTMTSAATSTASAGNTIAQTAAVASLRGAEPMPHVTVKAIAAVARGAGAWSQVTNLGTVAESSGTSIYTPDGTGIITVSVAGLYSIDAAVTMTASTFALRINKGSTVLTQSPIGSGVSLSASASTTRRLAAGDQVYLTVYPTTATSVSADTAAAPTTLALTRLSD